MKRVPEKTQRMIVKCQEIAEMEDSSQECHLVPTTMRMKTQKHQVVLEIELKTEDNIEITHMTQMKKWIMKKALRSLKKNGSMKNR